MLLLYFDTISILQLGMYVVPVGLFLIIVSRQFIALIEYYFMALFIFTYFSINSFRLIFIFI